jgi:hypothetical protein
MFKNSIKENILILNVDLPKVGYNSLWRPFWTPYGQLSEEELGPEGSGSPP